jgi:hypothetical protein
MHLRPQPRYSLAQQATTAPHIQHTQPTQRLCLLLLQAP